MDIFIEFSNLAKKDYKGVIKTYNNKDFAECGKCAIEKRIF